MFSPLPQPCAAAVPPLLGKYDLHTYLGKEVMNEVCITAQVTAQVLVETLGGGKSNLGKEREKRFDDQGPPFPFLPLSLHISRGKLGQLGQVVRASRAVPPIKLKRAARIHDLLSLAVGQAIPYSPSCALHTGASNEQAC